MANFENTISGTQVKLQPVFTNSYNYKNQKQPQNKYGGQNRHSNSPRRNSRDIPPGITLGTLPGNEINRGAINLIDNSSGDEAPEDQFETQKQSSFYI